MSTMSIVIIPMGIVDLRSDVNLDGFEPISSIAVNDGDRFPGFASREFRFHLSSQRNGVEICSTALGFFLNHNEKKYRLVVQICGSILFNLTQSFHCHSHPNEIHHNLDSEAMDVGTVTRAVVFLVNCGLIPLVLADGGNPSGSSSDGPNLRAKGLILIKIWCLIIVFVATFAGGISPYFYRWNETFLLLGTQFAAGVFLATAWMHFLSDSAETFGELTNKTYPFAFMLCTAGYLITMLADVIVVSVYEKHDGPSIQSAIPLQRISEIGDTESGVPTHTGETPLNFQALETPPQTAGEANMMKATSLVKKTSIGDSLLLILALCFHSVFEGIAIGVAATEADAWRALWTVCLHKIFAAIAMGIALLRIIPNRPFLSCAAYAFAFAISSPIGVAIGILIDATTQGNVADWIYAISMGFACGVFVYVAINHLLLKGIIHGPQNRIPFDNPFYKYLALVIGAGLIAVVMNWD